MLLDDPVVALDRLFIAQEELDLLCSARFDNALVYPRTTAGSASAATPAMLQHHTVPALPATTSCPQRCFASCCHTAGAMATACGGVSRCVEA